MARKTIVVDDVTTVTRKGPKGDFQKVRIKTGEHWLEASPAAWNAQLVVGDEVEVNVEPKLWKGKTFYNITAGRLLSGQNDKILKKLDKILELLGDKGSEEKPATNDKKDVETWIDGEDTNIPF